MHTLNQVLVGIFLGFVYGNIYNTSNYSIFIIIIIGFICTCLTIIKIDNIIKKEKIPHWVSQEMHLLIKKKQNISYLYKISHIYANCTVLYSVFISWNKLEYMMDIIINQIQQFEIKNSIKFDVIVGIKTGGAILSDYISNKLNIKNYKIKMKKNCNYSNNTFKKTIYALAFKRIYNNPIYQICEDINDNISNYNIILIDETISTSFTIKNVYNYLIQIKKVKYVYQQCIFINNIKPEYNYIVYNNIPTIFPWGYDN